MGMVESIADQCHVMDKGGIVASLTRSQLTDDELMRQYLVI
jgi:ABC-type branched-subunit amino acid transport system ATPase component